MNTYINLAWRNLWRNKKRTVIAASSVLFAVLLALLMRSMQSGYYDYMIDASVRTYTGYIQVHGKYYWEKRSLEESMTVDDKKIDELKKINGITNVVKRFETFALLAHENVTKVAQVTGIEPDAEDKMTGLKDKLAEGKYFENSVKNNPDFSGGIILAEGLADQLNAGVGDTIVIYGQGYHGVTAAELVLVQGIVKFNIPEQNKSFSYLTIPYAQWIFSAPERITSVSIMINDAKELDNINQQVKSVFDLDNSKKNEIYEVMTWRELTPELVQAIQIDNAQGIIMLGILYLVIAFGIFGTIMMMTAERVKEFGILISVGMKKSKLFLVTTLETIFISFIGVAAGAIISLPVIFYLSANPIWLTGEYADAILAWGLEPILPFAIYPGMFFAQIWTVLVIALLSGLYPINFIRKLNPVKAIRG